MLKQYPKIILEHFYQLRYGCDLSPTSKQNLILSFTKGSIEDGEKIQLKFLIDTKTQKIINARFKAYGNPVTLAMCDWFCQQVEGLKSSCLASLSMSYIFNALNRPDNRKASFYLLEEILNDFKKSA